MIQSGLVSDNKESKCGLTVVNALSDEFVLTSYREKENYKHTIRFIDGEKKEDKKTKLASEKKERANAIAEAETKLSEVKTEALAAYEDKVIKAKELYNKTVKSAQDEYLAEIKEAEDNKNKLVDDFIKDYGSYHMTMTNNNGKKTVTVSDLVDSIFNLWF